MVGVQTDSQETDLGKEVDGTLGEPASAETYAKEAFDYFQQKEYKKAVSALKKAIGLDPNNLNVRRRLLECYMAQDDYGSALKCLARIDRNRFRLLFDPDSHYDFVRLYDVDGCIYYDPHDPDVKAFSHDVEEAIKKEYDDEDARRVRGSVKELLEITK